MKNTTTLIIIAVLLSGASFFGGMQYGKNQIQTSGGNFRNTNAAFAGQVGGRNMRVGANGGFTGGQIISKDANGLTIGLQGGGSKIVLFSNSTQVQKSVSGTVGELNIGENVTVTGTTNSDGSISAQTIQIRPATTTRMMQ